MVGVSLSHGASQQLQCLGLVEHRREEVAAVAQGAGGAVVAVDQWYPAAGWQSRHDAVTRIGWNVIDMVLIDSCVFDPSL